MQDASEKVVVASSFRRTHRLLLLFVVLVIIIVYLRSVYVLKCLDDVWIRLERCQF